MTSARLAFSLFLLASCARHDPPPQAETHNRYGRLPLSFEVNNGQSDAQVQFLSRGTGYSLFLASNEAVVAFNQGSAEPADQTVLRMKLVDANPNPNVAGLDELPGKANYFTGNDPAKWRTNVATYSRVKYKDVYPGVDLVYYGNQQQLEYDFLIAPGADLKAIRMSFEGVDYVELDEQGDLVLGEKHRGVRQHRPRIYQEIDGEQKQVDGHYALLGPALVGFEIGSYDPHRLLVIDPVLSYSTYFGGSGDDRIPLIAVDATGQIYLAGQTSSTDFPTSNPLRPSYGGGPLDLFVAKLNAAGTALVYSTYLGGVVSDEIGSIAVDQTGNAYVSGRTNSPNFPRVGAFQQAYGGGQFDAFVAKLDATGSALVYSSYLGGSGTDTGLDCRVDGDGNFYLTGTTGGNQPGASNNFPTVNALQPTFAGFADAFVAKVNAAGSALIYSTYLGGNGVDSGIGIAVDAAGNAYVHGQTSSMIFPTVNPMQPAYGGGAFDVFVTKLDSTGTSLLYSTYLGGSGRDLARTIAVDATGSAYVTGFAGSADFPTVKPVQTYGGGEYDAFVAKLNPAGSALVYSTFLGGDGRDAGEGIAVDTAGNAYVAGFTTSTNFPTVNAMQGKSGGPPSGCVIGCDGFIAKLNSDGSALIYSTYFGGSGEEEIVYIALDADGNLYLTGQTTANDFPTVNPLQASNRGGNDVFVAKISELTRTYSIRNRGGVSFPISAGSALTAGYARIQPSAGSTTPSGVAIFGLRQNGVLVNEAGVPASPLTMGGRIYADVGGAVNTGIALANSNSQDVSVNFFFTNEAGVNSGSGITTIPANRQIARFLNEAPFNAGSAFRGTLTFSASAPIGAIALRGLTNERGEFLLTTLPVVDLSSAVSETAVVPHFADGGGWTTTIALVNSTDVQETGSIQFFSQGSASAPAQPLLVTVNNQQNTTFAYTVPPRTSVRLQTAGSAAAVRAGSVRVTPAAMTNTPSATAIFSFRNAGVTVTEAAASTPTAGSAFRTYVEAGGNQGAAGSIETGIAIATASSVAVPVNFELLSLDGAPTGRTGSVTVPAQGQVALFLGQIPGFQSLQLPFQGILRISVSGSSKISLTGLRGRYNERGDFLITTTPPANEATVPSNVEMMFPHWAIGGGYSTQFILLNGVSAQTSSGVLGFFSQAGQPLI